MPPHSRDFKAVAISFTRSAIVSKSVYIFLYIPVYAYIYISSNTYLPVISLPDNNPGSHLQSSLDILDWIFCVRFALADQALPFPLHIDKIVFVVSTNRIL